MFLKLKKKTNNKTKTTTKKTIFWSWERTLFYFYAVVELEMRSWKDEGFRKQKNVELDWKEQISYRIFQEDTRTKEKSLVYQGCKLFDRDDHFLSK